MERKSRMTETTNQVIRNAVRYGAVNQKGQKRLGSAVPSGRHSDFDEFVMEWGRGFEERLTAGTINSAMAESDRGDCTRLSMLYRRMLEREPGIAAQMQTRMLAVLSCDWSIRGSHTERRMEVETILKQAGIYSLLKHLLDALSFGYAGSAILWEKGGGSIQSFRPINPGNFTFDLAGNPALITLGGHPRAFSEYHPAQFILHTHLLKTDLPSRSGLLRPLLWLYFFKHYAIRDRARYLERFGIPFLAATIRAEDFESEETRTNIITSLSKMGSDGVGLLSEGAELQVMNPSSSSSSDYQSWMDYIDKLCALLILGQTATSGDASGFSKGQPQENVRRDLIEADCRSLMETIDNQLIRPLERWRYGTEGTLHFHLDYSSPENLLEKAEIVRVLKEAGCQPSRTWLEQTFGIELEPSDQDRTGDPLSSQAHSQTTTPIQ